MNTLRLITNSGTHEASLALPLAANDLDAVFIELLGRHIANYDPTLTFNRYICSNMPFGDERKTCPLLSLGYCSGMNIKGGAQLRFNLAWPKLLLGLKLQNLPETISDQELDKLNEQSPNCSMVLPGDDIKAFKSLIDDDNVSHQIRRERRGDI
jgi:hypothetical protein